MKSLARTITYIVLIATLILGMFWSGLIAGASSPALKLVKSWEADFGARHKVSESGEVTHITVKSPDFSDAEVIQLAELKGLRSLDLSGTAITDEGLEAIAAIQTLKTLRLDGTVVSDAGLSVLADVSSLEELSLARCKLTGVSKEGLGAVSSLKTLNCLGAALDTGSVGGLGNLQNLEQLYLGDTGLTSQVLEHVSRLPRLRLLNVARMEVNDQADFAGIAKLPALELLYLDSSGITDDGFSAMASACAANQSKLNAVFLEGCAITDESRDALLELVSLPGFAKLRLSGTQVSRSVYEELLAAAPEASFAFGGSTEE